MRRVVAAVMTCVTAAAGAAAQPPAATPPRPTFESGITVVSLPVYVTDSKGRSVTGLSAEDFVVEDNGRAVRVVGFREIDAVRTGRRGLRSRRRRGGSSCCCSTSPSRGSAG